MEGIEITVLTILIHVKPEYIRSQGIFTFICGLRVMNPEYSHHRLKAMAGKEDRRQKRIILGRRSPTGDTLIPQIKKLLF